MYLPAPFAESRPEVLHRIIREHALGILVTTTGGDMDANHLPFLLETDAHAGDRLLAHVARANPLCRAVRDGDTVLVIFQGEQGYISPNWYPGKQETHRRVPTWNYEVVHAHGTLHMRDDARFTRGVVARLTREHEAALPLPWRMGDAPTDFIAEELRHIVGLEIRITRLQGKRKLNQHHQANDREGAVAGLMAQGNTGLARAMQQAMDDPAAAQG